MVIYSTRHQSIPECLVSLTFLVALSLVWKNEKGISALATIDVTLPQLEYLAARLEPFECRTLVAALHYDSFELPKSLAGAERRISAEIPCLKLLVHWNSEEGRGRSHKIIEHRLRQLDKNDLADWLTENVSKEWEKEFIVDADSIKKSSVIFEHSITSSTGGCAEDEDFDYLDIAPWIPIDSTVVAIIVGLLFILCIGLGLMVIDARTDSEYTYRKANYYA